MESPPPWPGRGRMAGVVGMDPKSSIPPPRWPSDFLPPEAWFYCKHCKYLPSKLHPRSQSFFSAPALSYIQISPGIQLQPPTAVSWSDRILPRPLLLTAFPKNPCSDPEDRIFTCDISATFPNPSPARPSPDHVASTDVPLISPLKEGLAGRTRLDYMALLINTCPGSQNPGRCPQGNLPLPSGVDGGLLHPGARGPMSSWGDF